MIMHAERAYLFRHALLRDVAYQLQLPGDRANLHALAFEFIEQMHGGRAPAPPPIEDVGGPEVKPHATDTVAEELADHLRRAVTPEKKQARNLTKLRLHYLHRAALLAERDYRCAAAVAAWEEFAALEVGVPRAAALGQAAKASTLSGGAQRAQALLLDAMKLIHGRGQSDLEASLRFNLGDACWAMGQLKEAEEHYQSVLARALDSGQRARQANALGALARTYLATGRVQEAEQANEQAVAIARETKNRKSQCTLLGALALLYQQTGRRELGEATARQAMALATETGDRRSRGVLLGNLALLYSESNRLQQAEQFCEQALSLAREVGHRQFEGVTLGNLAGVRYKSGHLQETEELLAQALEIHREVGDRITEGVALANLATLQRTQGAGSSQSRIPSWRCKSAAAWATSAAKGPRWATWRPCTSRPTAQDLPNRCCCAPWKSRARSATDVTRASTFATSPCCALLNNAATKP